MARMKIRNYPSVDYMREELNEYFTKHRDEVIQHMLNKTGYTDLDSLWNDEYHCRFGFDCGYVWMKTRNNEQLREWVLDNGKYDAYVDIMRFPYQTQSTTLKKIQLDKAIKDLGLENQYYSSIRLD